MAKFHIREDGNPGPCTAADGNCPFGKSAPHYETEQQAHQAYEQTQQAEATYLASVRKQERIAWERVSDATYEFDPKYDSEDDGFAHEDVSIFQ
jgi:hypothetical protein